MRGLKASGEMLAAEHEWPAAHQVQADAQPVAPKPDGRLHQDGYFTWARRDGYAMDRRLPCDFWLQPAAAAHAQRQPLSAWQPIETAPKDGSYFLACNAHGVWVAHHQAVAVSGYKFDNPWQSVMLNHWHMPKAHRYDPATHWAPLPGGIGEGEKP